MAIKLENTHIVRYMAYKDRESDTQKSEISYMY